MTNIERHNFSNEDASLEFSSLNKLGPQVTWGTQVWLDYSRWICKDSVSSDPKPIEFVNHPAHYFHRSGYDAIVWIDRYNMDFCTGNCFKYLFRRGLKPGESMTKDEEKAKWYFLHEALHYSESSLLTWDEAKKKVSEKLIQAFGPSGRKLDSNGNPTNDWTKGGCDMPEAIEFIQKECLTLLKDGSKILVDKLSSI